MSLALEKNCNIDYKCLDIIVELAEKLRKEYCTSIKQKDIENDLRILKSNINMHSSYFRNHNGKVTKFVQNFLFKKGYHIFEKVTPLLQQEYNRGVANEITKYFNNYANKGNPSKYEKLLKLSSCDHETIKNNTQILKKFRYHNNRKIS
ncbi:35905_t:CDS:1 [Gigaspora margarita]|uniref:35905_t:CDS:1 n=1 Tax=Gigaspora margarita TaxID=4874 RepID=A0ABN7V8K5_GIGMA|nr:35905_t:CDS:1 [Gigaspora margarita]